MSDIESFSQRFNALMSAFENKNSFEAVYAFQVLHLEWAASVETSDPALAVEQYRLAEERQRTIGTYATGSGEGLASMAALYEIMGKRAEVEEALANAASNSAETLDHLQIALEIWTEINDDPNGMGEDTPASSKVQHLLSRIASLKI